MTHGMPDRQRSAGLEARPASSGLGPRAVAAAGLMCLVLGSVHAFSVFLVPMELRFGAPRAAVSLTYSLTLAALTLAVLLGPRLYSRMPATGLMLLSGGMAAAGTAVAALAPTLAWVWVGYSLAFGAANGIGYGFGLQLAAHANPGREGLAMGIVTACYAVGAALAPAALVAALSAGGLAAAMLGLAAALGAAGAVGAALLVRSGLALPRPAPHADAAQDDPRPRPGDLALLWIGYGAGVAAGLMAIGHAAGIAAAAGAVSMPWLAPTVIAICNMLGSLAGGLLADRMRPEALLGALPLAGAAALGAMAIAGELVVTMVGLGCVGFAYGATISAYPAFIAKRYGMLHGPTVYGRVFTAWGAAGLAGPWIAGLLYDRSGGYGVALLVAAALGVVSAIAASAGGQRRPDTAR